MPGRRWIRRITTVPAKYACKIPDGLSNEVACAALLQGLTALTLIRELYEAKTATGFWSTLRPEVWDCGFVNY